MLKNKNVFIVIVALFGIFTSQCQNTFSATETAIIPKTFDQLWQHYDPRSESLDIDIIKEWEQEGVIMRVVRFKIGVFREKKAMLAAIYGFPKNHKNLPALVQVHGGGQYADYNAVLTNAKRGYASVSISWAGRINAPDYKVNPAEVQLFFDNKTSDPDYKITTDWGGVDGYHAPYRNPKSDITATDANDWTLDSVESPRNNRWFLWTLAARRAITFLEQQPEVNPDLIGIYGHSMGGKITVLTAGTDERIKAAAPSCGGISDLITKNDLFNKTLTDNLYLENITCPIIFLSPSNDFHGHISDLTNATKLIETTEWRQTSSAHHNHQDTPEFEGASLLWFDQHLKKDFKWPMTPISSIEVSAKDFNPVFTVVPDTTLPISAVDVFYLQPKTNVDSISRTERINRFWHHAKAEKKGSEWKASIILESTELPLWVYANILYDLPNKVSAAGYYYRTFTTDKINVSSEMTVTAPDALKIFETKKKLESSTVIDSFGDDWQKDWFTYFPENWALRTHKIYSELWKAPTKKAALALTVRSDSTNKFVIRIDDYATEVSLKGGGEWQTIYLKLKNFKNLHNEKLEDWTTINELELSPKVTLKPGRNQPGKPKDFGADWKGEQPEYKILRWVLLPKK
ncbi:hypothetical protein BFP77_04515 [Maribacter sp. 4U21]|uniref:alpha/beta hydrolase family protein n=1 Tax=Maribacter sp. 4U21 TaxID=1889779 RepID=UPI000C159F31|nr:dienelactone hydrolase family protein [Maribacter sp. 4U21]PIB30403.1 hypothetical protein BFP77_04515 [Maribacter sp. 4U21]